MALNIDVDHGLRRPADLVKLVEAVVAGKDADEADWVEWKSTLDLTAAEGTFNLARQILGMANRNPDQAARFMEGLGYIVVGAEPGSVQGVTPLDLAKLDAALEKYLGSPSPVWGGVYVEVQGKDVLVVTVEAPRWGHRIYSLAKAYQSQVKGASGAYAGTVFVRKQARTVPAGPGELQMLQDRLVRGQDRDQKLDLVVEWMAKPAELITLDVSDKAFDEWIERRREAVLAMKPPVYDLGGDPTSVRAMVTASMSRDQRTREEYLKQVEDHLARCREKIKDGVVEEALSRRLNVIAPRATNPTARNLPDVELTLHFDPDARLLAFEDGEKHGWELPKPPKAFGTPKGPSPGRTGSGFADNPLGAYRLPMFEPSYFNPNIVIKTEPPLQVELRLGGLRPHAVRKVEPFLLVVVEEPGSTVRVKWSATSTRVDARQEGKLLLPVAATALALIDLVPFQVDGPPEDRAASKAPGAQAD